MHSLVRLLGVVLMCGVSHAALTTRHSLAEIFNGALYYVNTTSLVNGEWINVGAGKIGNIIYAPAFPGALYGNMTVAYGHVLPSTSTCETVLTDFSGYTGGYEVFPEKGWVEHYPILNSNVINGQTPAGLVHVRRISTYEDDNLIAIGNNPAVSRLFWRRNFPFPPQGSACTVAASVTPVGNSWVSGGATFQQYALTISNNGDRIVTAADVQFSFGGSAAIQSSWNLNSLGANTYSVALPAGVAIGGNSNSAGFIVKGSGSVTVSAPPAATICN
jgi:hypothetical protein